MTVTKNKIRKGPMTIVYITTYKLIKAMLPYRNRTHKGGVGRAAAEGHS